MDIKLRRLKSGEYIQFLKSVIAMSSKYHQVYMEFKSYIDPLADQTVILENNFQQSGYIINSKLEDVEDIRDKTFKEVKRYVKGILYHRDSDINDSILQIKTVIYRYESVLETLTSQKKTECFRLLISELEEVECLTSVLSKLDIIRWITHLKMVNTTYQMLYINKITNDSQEHCNTIKIGREKSYRLFDALITKLKLSIVSNTVSIEKAKVFHQVLNKIETLTQRYYTIEQLRERWSRPSEKTNIDEDRFLDS